MLVVVKRCGFKGFVSPPLIDTPHLLRKFEKLLQITLMTIRTVTLLGSSSGRNAGDAALIGAIMDDIDEAIGTGLAYEIPTIRPSYIRDQYRNVTIPISMLPWSLSLKMLGVPTYSSIMRSDLSLIFDAVLFDRSLYNPLFNHMSTLSLFLGRARKKGKLLGCYNVGLGPVTTRAGRAMLRSILDNMDFVTVRDADSMDLVRELGVDNPHVIQTADAALTLRPADEVRSASIIKSLGIPIEEPLVGFNINAYLDTWVDAKKESMGREKFVAVYADGINRFLREFPANVIFISTQHHDLGITKELMSKVTAPVKKAILSNTTFNHSDVKGALGRLKLMCGMRLHSCILSASMMTPTVGLVYQKKVRSFFNSLGLRECCEELVDFNPESLSTRLIRSWRERAKLRAALEKVIPEQQNEARKAARLVAALSAGRPVGEVINQFRAEAEHRDSPVALESGGD